MSHSKPWIQNCYECDREIDLRTDPFNVIVGPGDRQPREHFAPTHFVFDGARNVTVNVHHNYPHPPPDASLRFSVPGMYDAGQGSSSSRTSIANHEPPFIAPSRFGQQFGQPPALPAPVPSNQWTSAFANYRTDPRNRIESSTPTTPTGGICAGGVPGLGGSPSLSPVHNGVFPDPNFSNNGPR